MLRIDRGEAGCGVGDQFCGGNRRCRIGRCRAGRRHAGGAGHALYGRKCGLTRGRNRNLIAEAGQVHLHAGRARDQQLMAGRGLLDIGVDQPLHDLVAACCRATAQDDTDHPATVMFDSADKIEAGSIGIAGLDAVHALVAIHEVVVAGDRLAAELEALRREKRVVLREVAHEGDTEGRHVAGRGELLVMRKAGRVEEGRVHHAECAGLARHQGGKTVFAATDLLAHGGCRIIGRLDDHGEHGFTHRDRIACLDEELGRRAGGCMFRKGNRAVPAELAGLDRVQDHIDRHHLGQRCRMIELVGVFGSKHLAGSGIEEKLGTAGMGCCRQGEDRNAKR